MKSHEEYQEEIVESLENARGLVRGLRLDDRLSAQAHRDLFMIEAQIDKALADSVVYWSAQIDGKVS